MFCCCKKNILGVQSNVEIIEIETEEMQLTSYIIKNNKIINYDSKSYLNKGAFGQIYLLTNNNNDDKYIEKQGKICHLKRALYEAKLLIELKGKYTPNFIHFDKNLNFTVLTMEYIFGVDLFDYYRKFSITTKLANYIIMHVLRAIMYIFKEGYMHLDVKLENIIFNKDTKKITIIDLGSVHPKTDKITKTHYNVGTKDYAAPEIFLHCYHNTSDIYSIGCLYWILLTGKYPYDLSPQRSTYFQIPEEFPPTMHKEKFNTLNKNQQNFLKQTLKKNYRKRITYKKILDLPFINDCINDLNL